MTARSGKAKAAESFKDLGLIGSMVIVGAYVSKQFFDLEIPLDVQFHAGILMMVFGGSLARWARSLMRYGK